MNQLPLRGTRIFELVHSIAGPPGGLMLADLGADVIKIEDAICGEDQAEGERRDLMIKTASTESTEALQEFTKGGRE